MRGAARQVGGALLLLLCLCAAALALPERPPVPLGGGGGGAGAKDGAGMACVVRVTESAAEGGDGVARPLVLQGTAYLLHGNASASANRVDVVFVSEGYTQQNLSLFATHANSLKNTLLARVPYAAYANFFNVYRVDVASVQEGCDYDDASGNTLRDTALACSFSGRIFTVDLAAARAYADLAGARDTTIVLVNSPTYGGVAYMYGSNPRLNVCTTSARNYWTPEVLVHEVGHSFGLLADEYDYGGPDTYTGSEPDSPNASLRNGSTMAAERTKWYRWLNTSDASGLGVIYTYEGAIYSPRGIYRPTSDSLMRSINGGVFNAPSRESIVTEIYKLVVPLLGHAPAATQVGAAANLSLALMHPAGHRLSVQWFANGTENVALRGREWVLASEVHPCLAAACLVNISVSALDNTSHVVDPALRARYMTWTRFWLARSSTPATCGNAACEPLLGETCKACPQDCCPATTADCALRFNVGADFQYIKIQPSSLAPAAFSVALWLKLHSSNLEHFPIFTYANSQSPDTIQVYMGATGMLVGVLYVRNTALGTYPADNAWHHLVVTFSDARTIRYYVDGVQRGTAVVGTFTMPTTGGALVFFQEQDSLGGGFDTTQQMRGEADEIALYNSALGDAEVLQVMGSGPLTNDSRLLGYWTMDECNGTWLYNRADQATWVTRMAVVGSPTYLASGRPGASRPAVCGDAACDASESCASCAADCCPTTTGQCSSVHVPATFADAAVELARDFSLCLWARPAGETGSLFAFEGSLPRAFDLVLSSANVTLRVFNGPGNSSVGFALGGLGFGGVTGRWCHVCLAVWADAPVASVYLNGTLVDQGALPFSAQARSGMLRIGRGFVAPSFAGELDEVSVFNRTLGPSEVVALFVAPAPRAARGLRYLWTFDECAAPGARVHNYAAAGPPGSTLQTNAVHPPSSAPRDECVNVQSLSVAALLAEEAAIDAEIRKLEALQQF